MRVRTLSFLVIAMASTGLLLGQGATIIEPAHADDKLDVEQARELKEQGKILPLQDILQRVSKEHPGQVLETELEHESGKYIYELEILTDDDRVIEVKVDAGNGELLKVERED